MTILNTSTNADNLLALRTQLENHHRTSDMLDTRLSYNEEYQVLAHYLGAVYSPASGSPDRIYPHFLPTQASGRWSIQNPPLPNFPNTIRSVIKPDVGWPWICWDLDAIEAKIVAAYSHDKLDLEAFSNNYDIHTITACKMTGMPLPPDLVDPHHDPSCAEWRAKLGWKGKEDPRRILAKVRYCLLYGKDASAVKGSKYERDMVKMGFKKETLFTAAQQFLRSKPKLVATKRRYWAECTKRGESRTALGRRRKLFGDPWTMAKEGWNHMIQGLVVDMTNLAIIDLCGPESQYRFVTQAHDGVKVAVPETWLEHDKYVITAHFRKVVEREWTIEGENFISTATWEIKHADGRKETF